MSADGAERRPLVRVYVRRDASSMHTRTCVRVCEDSGLCEEPQACVERQVNVKPVYAAET